MYSFALARHAAWASSSVMACLFMSTQMALVMAPLSPAMLRSRSQEW